MELAVVRSAAPAGSTAACRHPEAERSAGHWTRPSSASPGRGPRPYDHVTATRVLIDYGVPFAVFDESGVCRELSAAARTLVGGNEVAARAWQQAGALAASALAADRVRWRGAERPVAVPALAGPWSLRAHVLPVRDAGRSVLILFLPAPPATATQQPPDGWGLTPREAEVAQLIADGASAKDVAAALGISVHTARRHTERVFEKLGVQSRVEVVLLLRMVSRPSLGPDDARPADD